MVATEGSPISLTAADMIHIEAIDISPHAIERLSQRGRIDLMDAASEIRDRLGNAHLIEPDDTLLPASNKQPQLPRLYFQDTRNPNIVFVLRRDQEGEDINYVLVTTLFRRASGLAS